MLTPEPLTKEQLDALLLYAEELCREPDGMLLATVHPGTLRKLSRMALAHLEAAPSGEGALIQAGAEWAFNRVNEVQAERGMQVWHAKSCASDAPAALAARPLEAAKQREAQPPASQGIEQRDAFIFRYAHHDENCNAHVRNREMAKKLVGKVECLCDFDKRKAALSPSVKEKP